MAAKYTFEGFPRLIGSFDNELLTNSPLTILRSYNSKIWGSEELLYKLSGAVGVARRREGYTYVWKIPAFYFVPNEEIHNC